MAASQASNDYHRRTKVVTTKRHPQTRLLEAPNEGARAKSPLVSHVRCDPRRVAVTTLVTELRLRGGGAASSFVSSPQSVDGRPTFATPHRGVGRMATESIVTRGICSLLVHDGARYGIP